MTIPSVQEQSFCLQIISYCGRKLHEIAKTIAAYVLRILQPILNCCFPRSEARVLSITQISPEEIQDLAENITTGVMERLNIGILGQAPIPNRFNHFADGTSLPVIGIKYDPNCPLLQRMKPLVANLLQGAFANGDEFMEGGFELAIRSRRAHPQFPTGGLLPADVSVQRILENFGLNDLDWCIALKLDRDQRENRNCLFFHRTEWFNRALVGHKSLTVHGASDAVKQQFLYTFA